MPKRRNLAKRAGRLMGGTWSAEVFIYRLLVASARLMERTWTTPV
jgi:hypothetical protein